MNAAEHDVDLLRAFARKGTETAFATVVRRHLDLVYGTAMRKLSDPAAAEEVAQDVFTALARSAWQFAPDDSVPAWLHRTTILKSRHWLRGELRRRHREQTAAELGTTMKTEEQSALQGLVPLLDEALLSLNEKERSALLLRYFERRSLREVGESLRVGEDTAQKRVAAAVERLSRFFQRRGFKTVSAVTAAAALQHTATAAPAALTNLAVSAALQSGVSAGSGTTALLTHLTGFTKAQTAAVCLVLAAAPLTWQWHQTRAAQRLVSTVESSVDAESTRQENATTQTKRLRAESGRLQTVLASFPDGAAERNRAGISSLAELRGRLVGLQGGADHGWPDQLPFVRVPKWAMKGVGSDVPAFGPSGKLAEWTREVLSLSSDQEKEVEANLASYLGQIDRLAATRASESNWTSADGFSHKKVIVAALGPDGQQTEDQLATNLATMFGPDLAKLVMSPLFSHNQWIGPERMSHELIGKAQEFGLAVKPTDSGPPDVKVSWQNHIQYGGPVPEATVPRFLMDRYQPWLQQLGVTGGVFSHPKQ